MVELYQDVALTRSIPEHHLTIGDVATVIDYVPHPTNGEAGCMFEVFNAKGESIAVVAIPVSAIEPLRADEILTVRSLVSVI
jgi:Domain of unknown function (DUF4926)